MGLQEKKAAAGWLSCGGPFINSQIRDRKNHEVAAYSLFIVMMFPSASYSSGMIFMERSQVRPPLGTLS